MSVIPFISGLTGNHDDCAVLLLKRLGSLGFEHYAGGLYKKLLYIRYVSKNYGQI